MNFLPKDERFFELFDHQAHILCQASNLLISGLQDGYSGVCRIQKEMSKLEDDGDHVVHDICNRLRATFITPFDPEDIQELATRLDDVLDGIDDVTFRIVAYELNPIPPAVMELAKKVSACCESLTRALVALQKKKPVVELCIEVHRLENEADTIERNMLADLFRNEKDPISLIRQKEIYELLEQATDRCEDVADVIQNVSVKNH
jgi:predicted phosphate transport protein (TIGR00153 family)